MMIINILVFLFVILLVYYGLFLISILKGLIRLKPVHKKEPLSEFVSIIIPFRNEEGNILENLRSIEAQDYPENKFEVIYVDDSSTDNSLSILESSIKNGNIRVLSLYENSGERARKKKAINFGIEGAGGEIIVTSDADCTYSSGWIVNLLSALDEKTGFISGPVELNGGSGIFSELQQIEFAGLILTGAGLIESNKPVISNAANIAYRKSIFKHLKGFQDQLHISSGDDGFLMQKIHKDGKYKVKFCLNRDAIVKTKPLESIFQFYQQRKRWVSKSILYKDQKIIVKLILIFFFYLGLSVQILLGFLISKIFFNLFIFSLLVKSLLELLILKKGKRLLFHNLQLRYFFLAELLQIPYIIISGIAGLFGNFTWKDRKVKR